MEPVEQQRTAPPVGEEVHMPAASGLPILNAVGLSLAIIGVTISRVAVVVGLAIFVISTLVWIVKARQEFDELPAEHHH